MTDRVKELLDILRDESNCDVLDYVDDAADLIESLAAELERVKQERDGLSIMLTAAESAAETYKRERDAAVGDISKECHKCKHFKVLFNGCTPDYDCNYSDVCKDNDHWQWRSVKEDAE